MMAEQTKPIERAEAAAQYARAPRIAAGEWSRRGKILFLLGSSLALWALILGVAFLAF